jgi:hypothetical protein
MSKLLSIAVPVVDSLQLQIQPPQRLKLVGRITTQEPGKLLGGFLRAIHDAVVAENLTQFELDITELKFVNSSSIRLFLDWASWVKSAMPNGYKLRILTTRKFTWQKTSFVAIVALAAGSVELQSVD